MIRIEKGYVAFSEWDSRRRNVTIDPNHIKEGGGVAFFSPFYAAFLGAAPFWCNQGILVSY
jgi:hypothetical protein